MADGHWMIAWFYQVTPPGNWREIQTEVTSNGIRNAGSQVVWIDSRDGKTIRIDETGPAPFKLRTPPFKGHITCVVKPPPKQIRDTVISESTI
ncbi:MAG: hypothetical protein P9M08_05690 [Candidatus Erginobacter occultus]|nr:hypothetical protein [Candidatus Erginobacter occultus]